MFTKFITAVTLLGCLGMAPSALALNASSSGSGSNTYLFIDNDVDKEYFITSGSLDPRFSGANVWTRYSTNQRSLGYLSHSGWSYANRYHDLWISNSPIAQPFLGIRCMSSGNNCPSQDYITPDVSDNEGFYHAKAGSSVDNSSYPAGTLSEAAYEYFRQQTLGASDILELNLCSLNSTSGDYDYASGQRCKDLATGGTWRYYTLTLKMVGHSTLRNTGSVSEIWIASDGTPSISGNSDLCYIGEVSNTSGLICKMVSYNLQQSERVTASLNFKMIVDTAMLGFNPAAADIQYSGNGTQWTRFATSITYTNVFTTGGDYVYVFMSNAFFKKVLLSGQDITNKDALFTFNFNNTVTPQSGFYQFTPSALVNITPKEYGISIMSSNGESKPSASGKIGSEQPPIELDYRVTVSASRMADSITAQVIGDSTTLNGTPYCVFHSADDSLRVPIPARLFYVSGTGQTVRARNSCGENPIDMTQAGWAQTAWNAATDDSHFFTTTLKLLFPMNDSRSLYTLDGEDWMGTVSASGKVKVTANWIGVER